jgi:hypothetical protein
MSILTAVIGLASALIAGFLAGRRTARLEYEKETRLAIAQVARGIGAATHTMSWLTWKATFQPHHLNDAHVEAYDEDMHKLYPELTGSLALTAALNNNAYERLRDIADDVYNLDNKIAQATTAVLDEADGGAQIVAALYEEARSLEKNSKARLADIMATISRTRLGTSRNTGPRTPDP